MQCRAANHNKQFMRIFDILVDMLPDELTNCVGCHKVDDK